MIPLRPLALVVGSALRITSIYFLLRAAGDHALGLRPGVSLRDAADVLLWIVLPSVLLRLGRTPPTP